MANFFDENDLIIIIDDDICPNEKEKVKFVDLQENIIHHITNSLDLVEDEYKESTLKCIDEKLKSSGKKLEDFMKLDIPKEFEDANLVKYHPFDISRGTITDTVKKFKASRNFIILDKFLEKNKKFELLKQCLSELSEIISRFYVCIVFYSSNPNLIESLDDAELFLNEVGLSQEEIRKLSMHVNFVNKETSNKLMHFETAFRKSQNNNLISLYDQSYLNTICELKKKIWEINNNEALIHYDYLMEGIQLDDIFYEIYKSRFDKIYNKMCLEKYEEYINPVRKTIQLYEADKSLQNQDVEKYIFISRCVKELNNLLKCETYLSECKKSDDIRFGDIFKLNDDYYMVVTQNCDLSIRLLDGRKSEYITLIKIEYLNEQIPNDSIANLLKQIFKQTIKNQASLNSCDLIKENIDTFKKLNIDDNKIDEIFSKERKKSYDIDCRDISIKLGNDIKLYIIESIFLDCVILREHNNDRVVMTKDNIEKSKEIRISTKRYLVNKLDEFICKYSELKYDSLKEISDKKIISDLLEIEFVFEKNEIKGFSVEKNKISRVGNLEYIKACDIFKNFMSKYSRFSYNNPPLI